MSNPFTAKVESYIGAVFISLLAAFFIGLIFISLKNLQSDTEVLNAQEVKVKTMSGTERALIKTWLNENEIQIPEGKGYKYLIQQYPSKPWIR